MVAVQLSVLRTALGATDSVGFEGGRRELARVGISEARRLGDLPAADRNPAPYPVRQILNVLVHELGVLEAPPEADIDPGDAAAVAPEPETSRDGAGPTERLTALAARFGRRFVQLPLFDPSRVAFAATTDGGVEESNEVDVAGMRIVLRPAGRALVELSVVVDDIATEPMRGGADVDDQAPEETRVVGVSLRRADHVELYLLPLWRDEDDVTCGTAEIGSTPGGVDISVTAPFPSSRLTAADASAVLRSVRASSRSGRNAWRAVARSRPDADAVRRSVVAGLR
ncbi:hypothetical protein BL253_18120 [Pseudofrankia asymbiotica]|uniref:Uncharacterized protein n=1 Tax=Pseudofrankia asymbiotica TaxID=1834516 RepID=A0A1V2I8P8_9ACTN|nr:hypothetical protein BL253_18120 [Pseudofrankia asymbiotica]